MWYGRWVTANKIKSLPLQRRKEISFAAINIATIATGVGRRHRDGLRIDVDDFQSESKSHSTSWLWFSILEHKIWPFLAGKNDKTREV